jgi:hypothetical protein
VNDLVEAAERALAYVEGQSFEQSLPTVAPWTP